MQNDELATKVAAALHEWQTLPQWKKIEIERENQVQFILHSVYDVVLGFKQCWFCSGSGILASQMEYCTDTCACCAGSGELEIRPTREMIKELIR